MRERLGVVLPRVSARIERKMLCLPLPVVADRVVTSERVGVVDRFVTERRTELRQGLGVGCDARLPMPMPGLVADVT